MARLGGLGVGRVVFLHVNNTNPALLADSPERAELERRGFEVAHDGMALELGAAGAGAGVGAGAGPGVAAAGERVRGGPR